MKVDIDLFQQGLEVLCKDYDDWINHSEISDQVEWVEELGIDLLDDNEFSFFGFFVHKNKWENPDKSDVIEFLECSMEEPEFRLLKFNFDGKLSNNETEKFKEWVIEQYTDPEIAAGVYTGKIECNNKKIVIFTSRQGSSFEGVYTEVLGIFRSTDEGKKFMFDNNGVFF